MKIPELRKKIIINFSASGGLLIILGTIAFFNFHERGVVQEKVDKIKNEASQIRSRTAELESKTTEIKKYRELWKSLSENKKMITGIKMDDINSKLTSIADKYAIISHDLKVTLPETLKDGIFKRTTVAVLFTTVNLTFTAVNDIKALLFVNEFLDSLPGYAIVTNFEIRKGKDYTTQDLVQISSGKGTGSISGKVDFYWYAYKPLEEKKSSDDATATKKEVVNAPATPQ